MAKFNPDTGVDSGREYDFKGAQANQAGEVLLKGTAGMADDFIKAEYTAVNVDINERARAGEEGIQDNLFNTADLAAAQSSTTTAGVSPPEELSRGLGKMERLKNAYSKGAITESDYLSSIDVLTKNLRHRYGDKWAPEIDNAVAGAVSNSANAYRRQLFQEWDAGKTAAQKALDKESDRKYQLVKENMDSLYGRPDIVADPDKFGTNEIMHEIMKVTVPKTLMEQKLTEYRLLDESGKATDTDRLRTGKLMASSFLGSIVDRSGASVNNTMMDMIKKAQADQVVDMQEKEAIMAYISSAQPHIEQGLNQMLLKEFPTMKQSDKDEIVAMGKSVIDMYRGMIFDDKTGLFAMTANRRAWAAEDAITRGMNLNPDLANTVAMMQGFKSVGMDEYANDLASKYLASNPDGINSPEFRIIGSLLVGEKNLNEYIQAAWDAKGDGKKVVEVFKSLRDAVTSENTATQAKAQAASVLFDPKNSEFLTSGMVDGALATRIYNELTTGDMVQTMSAMKGSDMVTWDNYYNWVFDPGFKSVFQYEMNTILPNADSVKLKFDSDTMTFSSTQIKDLKPGRAGAGAIAPTKETENFVKRMNVWIKKVTPILESNGDDVVYELNRIMEANGISEPKEGSDTDKMSFMQKAYSAMKKEQEKKEAEDKATTIPE